MNKLFFFLAFILINTSNAIAQTNWNELLPKAEEAYQNKNYPKAIDNYSKALELIPSKEKSSDVHYNLANSYYKNEQLGKAILHYEKAKLISSNNSDINYNLEIAKDEVKGDVIPIQPFFLVKWWNRIKMSLTSFAWGVLAITFLWLGIMGFLVWMFFKKREQKKYGFLAGVIFILLSIIPFIFAFGKNSIEKDSGRAILMVSQTEFRNAPDGTSEFIIYEGTEMEILDRIGEWSKVRLLNSDVGWVQKKEMEKI